MRTITLWVVGTSGSDLPENTGLTFNTAAFLVTNETDPNESLPSHLVGLNT